MGLFEQGFSEHRGGREWDSASAVIYQLLGVFEIQDLFVIKMEVEVFVVFILINIIFTIN